MGGVGLKKGNRGKRRNEEENWSINILFVAHGLNRNGKKWMCVVGFVWES